MRIKTLNLVIYGSYYCNEYTIRPSTISSLLGRFFDYLLLARVVAPFRIFKLSRVGIVLMMYHPARVKQDWECAGASFQGSFFYLYTPSSAATRNNGPTIVLVDTNSCPSSRKDRSRPVKCMYTCSREMSRASFNGKEREEVAQRNKDMHSFFGAEQVGGSFTLHPLTKAALHALELATIKKHQSINSL